MTLRDTFAHLDDRPRRSLAPGGDALPAAPPAKTTTAHPTYTTIEAWPSAPAHDLSNAAGGAEQVETVPVGVIDTNVFIHANANDPLTAECLAVLDGLARGTHRARLEPLVLHKLTHTLPRVFKQLARRGITAYLLAVLAWPGIEGEPDVMRDAVQRWGRTPGLGVVDAYLAALAARPRWPVFAKNVRELTA